MKDSKTLLEQAKEYRNLGWSIIPVKDKKALINWKDYQTRLATEKELEKWFSPTPDEQVKTGELGIALITGQLSGITVLDDDHYEKDETEYYHSRLTVLTGGGGRHLYYRYTEGIPTSVRIGGDKYDVRNEGGYVVLPPSIHKSGKRYEWVNTENFKEKLKNLPLLHIKPEKTLSKEKSGKVDPLKSLERGEGDRNTTLYKLGCANIKKLTPPEMKVFLTAINNGYKPSIPEKELEIIIKQVCKFYKPNNSNKIATIEEVKADRIEEMHYESLAPSTGFKELDDIVAGFVPGHVYLLSGETNAGKTSVAANFAVNVSKQKDKKVLYLSLETSNGILDFFICIGEKIPFKEISPEKIKGYEGNIDVIAQVKSIKELLKIIREQGSRYDLIIIDHIGYFITSDNTVQEQSNSIKEFARFAKEQKIAIMVVAHVKKPIPALQGKNRRLNIHDVSGSAALVQDSTEVLMLQRYKENPNQKDDFTLRSKAKLRILKSKRGMGDVDIYFHEGTPVVTTTRKLYEK